ncbi:loosenin [Cytidiella melzeri]|nr:loosenin [Cytidiella melzeri]
MFFFKPFFFVLFAFGAGLSNAAPAEVHHGDGTFYTPGLGACGWTNTESDLIVAVSHDFYDSYPGYAGGNPNKNPVCGKKLTISYEGKTVTATAVDRCGGCKPDDVDMSPAVFNQLADPAKGRIQVTWTIAA